MRPTVRARAGEVAHLTVVPGVTDTRILECAKLVGADLIVTGDQHLLKLRRFSPAGIMKVSTFLRVLGRPT